MQWKAVNGATYLIRVSTKGAEISLGPQDERTQAMYDSLAEPTCVPPSV
jgi:hypothetical protein